MFSVCSHLGGVPWPGPDAEGGTQPDLTGGYPTSGTPPIGPGWGGGGVPQLRYPPVRPGRGGTPPQVPPNQTWLEGTPAGGVPHLVQDNRGST